MGGSQSPDVYDRLTGVFRDIFDDDTLQLNPQLTAADVEGWDSLNHVRLMLAAEKAFKVRFAAAEIAKLKNVGQFVDLICSKL